MKTPHEEKNERFQLALLDSCTFRCGIIARCSASHQKRGKKDAEWSWVRKRCGGAIQQVKGAVQLHYN